MTEVKRALGWIRQHHDDRDFKLTLEPIGVLPSATDLRPGMPPVYDQGLLSSCTANAFAAAFQYDLIKEKLTNFVPSRLFIYFNERAREGSTAVDAGAVLRDGAKSLAKEGVCKESEWPYILERFAVKPPTACYKHALNNRSIDYRSPPTDLNSLKYVLAIGQRPVVFGFVVYQSFMSREVATTGLMPMPGPNERSIGGHAVCLVGYDDATERFIVRNSWGATWGQNGYFTMPYAYVESSNVADFWVIRTVS